MNLHYHTVDCVDSVIFNKKRLLAKEEVRGAKLLRRSKRSRVSEAKNLCKLRKGDRIEGVSHEKFKKSGNLQT